MSIEVEDVRRVLISTISRETEQQPDRIDVGRTFSELGVDSVMTVEIVVSLESALGLHDLDPRILRDHPTVDELSRALAGPR